MLLFWVSERLSDRFQCYVEMDTDVKGDFATANITFLILTDILVVGSLHFLCFYDGRFRNQMTQWRSVLVER